MRPALATGLTAVPATSLAANRWFAGNDPSFRLVVGGIERTYVLHVPASLPPTGGFSLILAFHGDGGQGTTMARLMKLDAFADRRGFIVVYPDSVDRHWNDGRVTGKNKVDDVGFVSAVLDDIRQRYPIHPGRVFAMGISNGALFAERLGCELADRVSAIAPVSGTMPADIEQSCRPARPVSVLQIDGTDDPIMPYAGRKVADFGGRGRAALFSRSIRQSPIGVARMAVPRRGPARCCHALRHPMADVSSSRGHDKCRDIAKVELMSVEGGGHTWPGGSQYLPARFIGLASDQLDASAAIVEFFLSLPPRQLF